MTAEYALRTEALAKRYRKVWALRDCTLSIAGARGNRWAEDGPSLLRSPASGPRVRWRKAPTVNPRSTVCAASPR